MAQEAEESQGQPPAETCAYRGELGSCEELRWLGSPDGYCLYHAPENGKDAETARRVWDEARQRGTDPKRCDCSGWHFPADPETSGFSDVTFEGVAEFDGATFKAGAWFHGATFEGGARFNGATFKGGAGFHGATFKGRAWFGGATFEGDARFFEATFEGDVRFDGATFKAGAGFHGATFEGYAGFLWATFEDEAWFGDATFKRHARFDGATFKGDPGFDGVTASRDVAFDLPTPFMPFRKPRPFARREYGEIPYRLAKQTAQDRGDYRRAGNYHFAEQCAINHGRLENAGWKFWRPAFWLAWLEFIFARSLFGYGEKPQRVLLAALVVILCFTGLYFGLEGIESGSPSLEPSSAERLGVWEYVLRVAGLGREPAIAESPPGRPPSLGECLHFSVVTFTTLGYGDFQPKPHCRFLADAEALIGAAMMALFVVSLARRYTR
ncbi:MAG TPA: potassium channel family protein [Phycisphaerae bacterium]|nr:potassium channel family protein [Phycisphaerae bacterium]